MGFRWWRHPLLALPMMATAFFAVSLYIAWAAFNDFSSLGSTNTGIVTQAVASTTFGHNPPFFETFDCIYKGRCSFLLVHPGFILYLASPFFAIAPTPLTLFALQSAAVAAAAFPLYWLTVQVTRSSGKALFAAGLYLIWAPLLAGEAFTLHLECLLPVELIGLAALWQSGRYRWGLTAALVAFLSFEIAPVFVFLIGLFFLAPHLIAGARRVLRPAQGSLDFDHLSWLRLRSAYRLIRGGWSRVDVRYSLLLMTTALVALVLLYSFMNLWGSFVLGVQSPVVPHGISGLLYDSSTPGIVPTLGVLTSSQTVSSAAFWLILLGLAGFLPCLAPRTLVIWGPWVLYTFVAPSQGGEGFTTLGLHLTSIAAGPIFIGVAYGLRAVPSGHTPTPDPDPDPEGLRISPNGSRPPRSQLKRRTVLAGLAIAVVANALLSPVNPLLPDAGFHPGPPFTPGYFSAPLEVKPGLAWTEELLSVVPRNATIASDGLLFPYVASFQGAIDFQPFDRPNATSRLPFNVSQGPEFDLVEESSIKGLGGAAADNLSNPQKYGLRGYVSSTAVGPLLLYQRNYFGVAARYGPALAETNLSLWPESGLVAGPNGLVEPNASAPYALEIHSLSKSSDVDPVWTGPGAFLAPGTYRVLLEVSAAVPHRRSNANATVLGLTASGFGPTLLNETFTESAFSSDTWTNLTLNFTAVDPEPLFNIEGFALNAKVSIAIAYLAIVPTRLS